MVPQVIFGCGLGLPFWELGWLLNLGGSCGGVTRGGCGSCQPLPQPGSLNKPMSLQVQLVCIAMGGSRQPKRVNANSSRAVKPIKCVCVFFLSCFVFLLHLGQSEHRPGPLGPCATLIASNRLSLIDKRKRLPMKEECVGTCLCVYVRCAELNFMSHH